MDLNIQITDMAGAYIEHSMVITNFCAIVTPQFVMEVLSDSTENYDRGEKMELYREQEISEYWIVNWNKREVEIYNLDYDEKETPKYYLWKTITESNKDELKIIHFPHIKIDFDELFDIEW